MKNESVVGTGWAFPPEFSKQVKDVVLVSENDEIRQSLYLLLGTAPGERPLELNFGTDLSRLLYEPLSESLQTYVKDLITSSILDYEARIVVDQIDFHLAEALNGIINIEIDYTIRSTNERTNIVYPFYLEEF